MVRNQETGTMSGNMFSAACPKGGKELEKKKGEVLTEIVDHPITRKMVGASRFERPTPRSRTVCAYQAAPRPDTSSPLYTFWGKKKSPGEGILSGAFLRSYATSISTFLALGLLGSTLGRVMVRMPSLYCAFTSSCFTFAGRAMVRSKVPQ
jgi:hypothetical protein